MYKKFAALLTTNFFGVMNDNFLKTLACFIAVRWVAPEYASLVVSASAGALVLPYILFSPLAGDISARGNRARIVVWAKVAELPIMGLAIMGFMMESVWVVVASIVLMGLQSSLYSPAKYALIRDIGGMDGVPRGMGAMEAVSFLGMLSGMLLASFLVDSVGNISYLYMLLLALAGLGLVASLTIKSKEKDHAPEQKEPWNPLKFINQTYRQAKQYPSLNPIIMTLSVFWWLAASLQIGLLIYCQQSLLMDSFTTGIILSMAAVGITVGCFISGIIQSRGYVLSIVVPSAFVMAAILMVLFFVQMPHWTFGLLVFVLALFAGLFKVPLDSAIQQTAKGDFLSTTLAYLNQVSFLFILMASVSFALLTWFLEPRYLFLMLGIVFVVTPIYLIIKVKELLIYTGYSLLKLRYRVKITGLDIIDPTKTYLIIPNHQAVVDPMLLYGSLYKTPPNPLIDQSYFGIPVVGRLLHSLGGIPVPNISPSSRDGVAQAAALQQTAITALQNHKSILLYPAGQITHTGTEKIGNKQLTYHICGSLPEGVEVLGVRINGLWGSIWSRKGRSKTPNFALTMLKGIALFPLSVVTLRKRRVVQISMELITDQVLQWSKLDKKGFNGQLEKYYNEL